MAPQRLERGARSSFARFVRLLCTLRARRQSQLLHCWHSELPLQAFACLCLCVEWPLGPFLYDASLCRGRIDVEFAILGLNDIDRDLQFEHDSASGSHPVPLQAPGCPRTDLI